jgi:hypothetical protein
MATRPIGACPAARTSISVPMPREADHPEADDSVLRGGRWIVTLPHRSVTTRRNGHVRVPHRGLVLTTAGDCVPQHGINTRDGTERTERTIDMMPRGAAAL